MEGAFRARRATQGRARAARTHYPYWDAVMARVVDTPTQTRRVESCLVVMLDIPGRRGSVAPTVCGLRNRSLVRHGETGRKIGLPFGPIRSLKRGRSHLLSCSTAPRPQTRAGRCAVRAGTMGTNS